MSDAEKSRADAIAKFGAEEFERLEKFATTLVRKSTEQPVRPNRVVKTKILYSLRAEQEYLWVD